MNLIIPIIRLIIIRGLNLADIVAGHVPVGEPQIDRVKLVVLEVAEIGRKIFCRVGAYAPRWRSQTSATSRSASVAHKRDIGHRDVVDSSWPAINEGGGTGTRGPSRL